MIKYIYTLIYSKEDKNKIQLKLRQVNVGLQDLGNIL